MSVRFNLVLSDDLNSAIDKAAAETESNKSEILRKALQLYLAARWSAEGAQARSRRAEDGKAADGNRRLVSTIDLNAPPPHHTYSVSVEREESKAERNVRLFKDVALFLTALVFIVAIAITCFSTLLSPTAGAEEKKWAMSVPSAAAGGLAGYLIRK